MKKFLAVLLAALMLAALAAGCAQKSAADTTADTATTTPATTPATTETPTETKTTIRLGGLKGPTTMGMVKLLDDAENGLTKNDYQFQMAASADELTPLLLKGELDILAVPVNLGAVLYNNSKGAVQLLAINTLGVIYIVEKGGNTVTDWASLKGKTIYSTGKGSTPEYALNYLLQQNGLDPAKDVTVEWKSEPTEVVAAMAAADSAVGMLPQPFVTVAQTQIPDLHVVLDLTKEWDALNNGSRLLTAGLVVRTAFAKDNPDAVAAFLTEYQASTEYVTANVADAAKLVEKYDIVKAPIAEKAIPFCNIVCITGSDMKSATQGYFQVLFDQNPKAVGGTLPGDDFYYVQ